nr:olfactory receptor 72 [Gregopimpla kuwanae]
MFFVVILVLSLIPQATALFKVRGHLLLMIENMIISVLFCVSELELTILWNKNEVIATMMEYMKNDWLQPKTEQERDVMLSYGKATRILTIGGYLIIAVTIMFYHSPVFFGVALRTLSNLTDIGDRPFALQSYYFFYPYNSPVYELVVLSQLGICFVGTFCYTTVGTLFGAIVLHVSAQLENLYNRMENMAKGDDAENFEIEFRTNMDEHERLIRFSGMIESTFSLMLLGVIAGFTMMFCMQGYEIIEMLSDDIERPIIQIAVNIFYVIYATYLMFGFSAVGQTLVTQSEKIQYATYNCEWYNRSAQEAAQLIPVLVRSQRPLVITAGKFVSLNLAAFATLLKTTGGYISCLLAAKD